MFQVWRHGHSLFEHWKVLYLKSSGILTILLEEQVSNHRTTTEVRLYTIGGVVEVRIPLAIMIYLNNSQK